MVGIIHQGHKMLFLTFNEIYYEMNNISYHRSDWLKMTTFFIFFYTCSFDCIEIKCNFSLNTNLLRIFRYIFAHHFKMLAVVQWEKKLEKRNLREKKILPIRWQNMYTFYGHNDFKNKFWITFFVRLEHHNTKISEFYAN